MPFGKLFRRGQRDKMRRYYEPDRETYWAPYRPEGAAEPSAEKLY